MAQAKQQWDARGHRHVHVAFICVKHYLGNPHLPDEFSDIPPPAPMPLLKNCISLCNHAFCWHTHLLRGATGMYTKCSRPT